ncbi:MAG: ATP-binding protein [Mucilaginibacter sp.]
MPWGRKSVEGYIVLCRRLPRLFQELPLAKGDGNHCKLFHRLAKMDVLLFGWQEVSNPMAKHRRDLLESIESHHGSCSIIDTSQLSLDKERSSIW